jgi:hypothetical protein
MSNIDRDELRMIGEVDPAPTQAELDARTKKWSDKLRAAELDAATPPEGAAQGRDTERLNWLASNAARLHRHPNTGEWYVGQWHDIDTRGYPHAGVQLYESARQAIDAALATLPAAPKQEP